MTQSLYDEYEGYVKKYKEDYGENVVVLYRCGQFFEMYSANDGLIDIKKISELLNIQVSRRNKAILEVNRSNTLMAGFPMFALQKFVKMLVDSNHVVVVVDQVSDPPKPKRAVTEVISPGTIFDDEREHKETSCLMSLYIEDLKEWRTGKMTSCIGLACIDISTGVTKVAEMASQASDTKSALDETYRIISAYKPKEIIIFGNTSISIDELVNHLEIGHICIHDRINRYPVEITSLGYQDQFFKKIYPNHGLYTVLEYLNLEKKQLATVALVYLLQYAMRHNETILNNMAKPCVIEDNKYLILNFNAAKQLNIVNNDERQKCLLNILNNCDTAIGKRRFQEVLLTPIVSCLKLEKRYDLVEALMQDETYSNISASLKKTYDLERLVRKMNMCRFHPSDFIQVDETINAVIDIIEKYNPVISKYFKIGDSVDEIKVLCDEYSKCINMQDVGKYHLDNIDSSFFNKGVHVDLDVKQNLLDKYLSIFDTVIAQLNKKHDNYFKVEYNERDGYFLTITAKRYSEIKNIWHDKTLHIEPMQQFSELIEFKFSDFVAKPISASSSSLKVAHKLFSKITDKITVLRQGLKTEVIQYFKRFVSDFIAKYERAFERISKFIGKIDVACTNARNAVKFRYFRPKIQKLNDEEEKSYFDIKDLRHPIIERVNEDIEYVTNDVCLGKDINGILLFGLNCSGKTSLSKAIALNIIMAQSGSFVPSCLEYYPYKSIFTRIPSGDDIYKSMSTFAVEISELRNILNRSNAQSLIVGDEISHGTEVVSGVAIVGAAIHELANRQASFIFATHLHNITEVPQVTSLNNIRLCHLSVVYDEDNKRITYDRKLKDGPGSSIYGLEVCRGLDLPKPFLDLAYKIRSEQMKICTDVVSFQKSKYNAKVYFDACSICNKKTDEIHHIKEQHLANDNGYVLSTACHINAKHNLINVCAKCHDDIHNKLIKVNGYVQTTDGIKLQWTKLKGDDLDANIVNMITSLRKSGETVQGIIKKVATDMGVTLTRYKVQKMLKAEAQS